MELVATESDLMTLALRIRAAKSDLLEAIRVKEHAKQDLINAENAVLAARERFSVARGQLVEVAGGSDDPAMWWS